MANLFIFGMGYSASIIAARARALGWQVSGTGGGADLPFADEAAVRAALADCTHILSSVPPAGDVDPVLDRYADALNQARWLGYLSSTGVYGDTGGAWVDETAPIGPDVRHTRRAARVGADARWLHLGARVFRLPGIYGPGRSALDRVRAGKAHRIAAPEQVFSRIHVADIASGVLAALTGTAPPGAYNLADDTPCHPNAVIEEAGLRIVAQRRKAGLGPAARGFYGENRRVANGKAKRLLGWRPLYPGFAQGLAAILAGGG